MDMSAFPTIPEELKNIRPLSAVISEQQEVSLEMPKQLAATTAAQPTLTQQLIQATIGTAPPPVQGQPPAPPPPAQLLTSPTSVAPVIMVDTTSTAMAAEGLQGQQQQQPRPQTVRIKRTQPQQGGGDQEEGEEGNTTRNYSQNVSFIKLV